MRPVWAVPWQCLPIATCVWVVLTKIAGSGIKIVELVGCSSDLKSVVTLAMHNRVRGDTCVRRPAQK